MGLKLWRNISIAFSVIAGVLLHFTYEWSGQNSIVALFSSVNESTWEHLKLAFFPMLIISVIGYFIFGKNINNYIEANTVGILTAISFITVFFYTYSGIIGDNYAVINILDFVVGVILGEVITYELIKSGWKSYEKIYVSIIGILIICFVVFTYYPPQINFFKDPVNNTYGVQK